MSRHHRRACLNYAQFFSARVVGGKVFFHKTSDNYRLMTQVALVGTLRGVKTAKVT